MNIRLTKRALSVWIAAAVAVPGSVTLSALESAQAGPSDPVTAGIAAYFPDSAGNRSAITTRSGIGVVVMNTLQSLGASAAVADYKGAGKRVFGYFAAGYAPSGANGIAPKTLSQLQTTATAMLTAYPSIDGLFLDEVLNNDPAGCAAPAAFYIGFYGWFKSAYPAKSLILNPGTALCASFANSADIYLVYENRLGFYRSAFQPYFALPDFDWLRGLPNSQVWSIIYGVPVAEMSGVLNEMADYAGIVTVLSDNADHPYSNVAPTVELDIMNSRATGVALPTTTTVAGATTTIGGVTAATTTVATGGGAVIVPPDPAGTATTTVESTTTAVPATTTTQAPTTTTATTAVTSTTTTASVVAPAIVVQPVAPKLSATAQSARIRYVLRRVTRCRTTRTKSGKRVRSCRKVTIRVGVRLR